MTMRATLRTLTGKAKPRRRIEVVLGFRSDGSRGVSLQIQGHENIAFTEDDAYLVENLWHDPSDAVLYLRGGKVY